MGKIIGILIMLVCIWQGLIHFGVIGKKDPGANNRSKKEYGKLINDWDKKKTKTTDQIKGSITNINDVRPSDLQENKNQEMRNKFPDVSSVFGVDNSRWLNSLTEEDFTILREIRAKLDSGQPISDEDENRYRIIENRGVIDAIRQNNPSFNQQPASNPEPEPYPEPEPEYDDTAPVSEPEPVSSTPMVDDPPPIAEQPGEAPMEEPGPEQSYPEEQSGNEDYSN